MSYEAVLPEIIVKEAVINGQTVPAVTSLQVAETFGKEHFNVLRDIRETIAKCSESFIAINFDCNEYKDSIGRTLPMYVLSKDGFMMIAMSYTTSEAMKLKEAYIARFNEMERELASRNPVIPNFDNPALAARAWAEQYERRQLAEAQRDEAIRTKAWISDKKTATAMATASHAVQKIAALENALGEGRDYKTVKAIPWLLQVFQNVPAMYSVVGRKLVDMSKRMGYDVKHVEDTRFGEVKAYHVEVIDAFYYALQTDLNMLKKYRLGR
jgi:Rha family phage regulatory protein